MKAQHALFLLFSTHLLTAAPDTVDPTFAASAGQFFDASDFGTISSVLVQPDGKILFGSNEMSAQSGTLEVPLVRFNPDGSLDNTFFADNEPNGSDSGIYFDSAGWPEVHALGLQSDGKIIAAGVMQGVRNGTAASPTTEFPSQSIVRFNADGTIDTTLQTNGTLSWPVGGLNYIEELTVQPDDKIICVGGFGGFRDTPASAYTTRYGIARLNANGSLDTGFQIDPSEFGVPAGASLVRGWFRQATLDSCGNIYLAGLLEWGSQFSPSTLPVLARLYPDGTRDTGFNPTPPAGITDWQGVTISADGRILAYGITSSGNILQRYFDDGSLDNSFTLDPTAGQIDTRPLRLDGPFERILLAQNNAGSQSSLVRLISNGNLDNTFSATAQWTANPNGSQPGFFQNFTTGWNGTIYSGDGFDSVNGTSTNKVVAFEGNPSASSVTIDFRPLKALESQGTLYLTVTRTGDTTNAASANYSFTLTQASVNDLVPTPGSISWAAGEGGPKTIAVTITDDSFVEGDENLIFVLSALTNLTDLGGDSTTITIIDDEVAPSITSQPTSITVAQGNPASFSVAVTSPVPPTFQWRKDGIDIPGANSSTYSISSTSPTDEADYTVVVTNLTGSTTSSPATLTVLPPSASVDPTFTPAAGLQPNSLAILPDNSLIILDGNFSSGYTLKKILPDGSVDATFNPTFSLISGYSSLNIDAFPLPNGQFIISGNFADVNGTARPQLARLNADGTLDPTFDAALPNAFNSPISGVAVTSSGTVYYAFKPGGQAGGLRRALNDGSTDPSFNTAIASNTNGFLWALEELPDGSLLISHTSGSSFSFTRGITRLNSDGSDFPGFNSSTALFPQTTDFALLPDGSFAAARNTTLELYDPLGNVLDTFTFTDAITSVHYHRGRLIVTGPTEYNSTPIPGIARLSLDGTLDTNFPGGSGPNANVQNAAFDSSDRLVTFGTFTTWNGESRNRIARLTLDNPEIAFATLSSTANETDGTIAISLIRYGDNSSPASVTVTSTNGTASAPGDFTAVNQVVTWPANDSTPQTISVTLLDDSTLDGDLSFTLALSNPVDTLLVPGDHIINILDDDSLPTITQQPANTSTVLGLSASFAVTATSPTPETYQWFLDGVAIPSATSATYNIASASANDEGSYTVEITNSYATITSSPASLTLIPDPTEIAPGFSPVPAFNSTIYALENTPDGGVFVGGQFTNYNGFSTHDYLVKINPDGTHDSSFTPPAFNNSVRDLALQDDGKLLVVGNFSSITGSSARRLIRLNTDGSIDTTFASAIADGANGDIYAVEIEPDGNILLAGAFSSFANTSLSSGSHDLIRLAPDGSVLANTTNDLSVRIQDLQLLPNGQFLAAYDTSSSSAIKVRRYNSDLTPDFSFTYSSGRTEVEQIALANDGDYLFAGPNNLLKINPDATTDTTFFTHNARDVEVQLNGKILAGSSNSPRLFRFLPDTTADPIFTLATPPNGEVNRLAIREDGKTWVAGAFSTFNGLSHSRLVLINGDAIPLAITSQPDSLVLDPTEAATFSISATGTSAISFQWFKDGTPLSDSANISGSNTDTLTITSVSESNEGDYTCTVTNDSGSETSTPANLLVRGAPEYTSQPSDLTQLAGGSLTLTAEVIGASPLTYQWLLNNQPLADGGNISGATTNSLTISPAGTGDSGTYTLVATNGLGSTNSNDITVTINPNPAAIADGYTPPTIDGAVEDILPLPGGGVLIAGSFSSVTDGTTTSNSNLAVVEEGGTVRNLPNLSAGAVVRTLHRQADGKILLGGDFAQVNGVNQSRLARLNADFTLDTSFVHDGPAFGFGSIYDLVTDSSGDIYVGGTHFGWGTTGAYAYLTKLMPDGTHDLSFAPTMSSWVYSLAMAADDDLYAGGLFTNVDGDTNTTTDTYLVRLNPDGTVDFGFAADHSGTFSARNIYLDSQNRLYANSAFNNTFRRYLPDGSVDTSFTNTFNSRVLAYAEDSNGLPLFGGLFTTVDSSPSSRLARLDATFTLDPAFEVGSGFDNQVNVITPSGNNLWIGGTFLNYNGVSSPYLAKLQGDQESDPIEAYYDSFGIPVNERDDNANNDGDNFPLLFEYLYEFDPTLPDSWSFPLIAGNFGTSGADINALEPTANLDPNKTYRGVRYRLPKDMKGLTYEVEATRDLTFVLDGSLTVNEFGSPIDDGDYWIRSFYFTPDLTQIPALFYRLQISRPD